MNTRRDLIDRRRERAWALQVHYLWESLGEELSLRDALARVVGTRRISGRRLPRVRELVGLVQEHREAIDAALESKLDNWDLDRLASVDRGVLRIAAAELLFEDRVPPKVAIHEGVRLAEAYGGRDSPRFVNGVLDALYKAGEGR